MDKSLWKLPGIKRIFFHLTWLIIVQVCTIIVQATTLAKVISALFAGAPLQEQAELIIVFVSCFVLRQLAVFWQQKLTHAFAERTGSSLRRRLLDALFRLGPRHTHQEGTGTVVTLVLEGIAQYRTYLELFIPRMVGAGIIPAAIVVYIWMQDKIAATILMLTMPILIIFLILVGLAARLQSEKQWQSFRLLSNHFVDSLRGLETLKFLGRSRAHGETIAKVSQKFRAATMRTLRVAFLSSFALDFFTMLSVASVAVSLGLRLIDGNMTLVTGLTVLILAPEYFLPIRLVGADYHATLNGKEAGKAIFSLLETEQQQVRTVQKQVGAKRQQIEKEESGRACQQIESPIWTASSTLALHNVTVQHDLDSTQRPSLKSVSLELKGHQMIGIIGESGAGKSTFIDVLGGFIRPTSGEIIVDGQQLQKQMLELWQQNITYIPQHPYIYSSSLADNIRFYHPEATIEQVEQAAKEVGLDKVIQSMPNGLHELIGDGGRALSGGQEQRVTLARAFLSGRSVILLDEPTAHLDIETELELKETILKLFRNRLVFIATHRLHWMQQMDRILVLDKGALVEDGTHQELVRQQGSYYKQLTTEWEEI